ncbi:thiolase family protein [Peribacillus frigoritolerans]|uniref:thiolase family protein n=1 Tax=Peribacillus frigoritolerans TaxID=450367 RepID=UPI003D2909B1
MRNVVIVSGMRTPIGDFLGSLKDVSAVELGTIALKAAIDSAGISASEIEEVVGGQIYQAGCKGNTARQVALNAGCAVEATAVTINQQCPSSMRATDIVCSQIMLGRIDIGAAVGYESMSNAPYLLSKSRGGLKMGDTKLIDSLLNDALIDAFNDEHMGMTAERLAERYHVTREEQDELAQLSHSRAIQAMEEERFVNEVVPVHVETRKGTTIVSRDEHPNMNTSVEELSNLRPAFKKHGTVTAGNASSLNDGAAALILMAEEKAKELGLQPLARIVSTASAAVNPKLMGIGVVPAVQRALKIADLSIDDIDYWEINEAFAAQFIAVNRELDLDMEKVNVNGSGISLGHPVGCTGARLIVTMLNEMQRRKARYGCASLCAGGGPAAAIIVESM